MPDISNEQKMLIAKQAAGGMFHCMAGIPPEVQLEAILILMKAQFMGAVRPDQRLKLFNEVMAKIRQEIKESVKGKSK